jgi:hypothetical protein
MAVRGDADGWFPIGELQSVTWCTARRQCAVAVGKGPCS